MREHGVLTSRTRHCSRGNWGSLAAPLETVSKIKVPVYSKVHTIIVCVRQAFCLRLINLSLAAKEKAPEGGPGLRGETAAG